MKWHKLEHIDWTDEGSYSLAFLKIGSDKICLLKRGNNIDAFQNKCPHAGGSLSEGWIENDLIVCPVHRHKFNVKTGRENAEHGNCIKIYPIKKVDGDLYVGLSGSIFNPANWF